MAAQFSSESVDSSDDKQETLDELRRCEFSKKTWKEDMTLVVECRKLFVSSSVLALVSPVLQTKFGEQFKEGASREVYIDDQHYDDVLEFLRCVYPNILKPISQQNVFQMLPLAEEYQVQALTERCEKFLVADISDSRDCTRSGILTNGTKMGKYLQKASAYGLERLRRTCIYLASNQNMKYLQQVEQHPIPKDIMLEIRNRMIERLEKKVDELDYRVRLYIR